MSEQIGPGAQKIGDAVLMYKIRCNLPPPGAFSQSKEVLLPRNCRQLGSDKLKNFVHRDGAKKKLIYKL